MKYKTKDMIRFVCFMAGFLFVFMVWLNDMPSYAGGSLVINEIVGSNSSMTDGDGDSPDWIEIYNGTEEEIDLKGWGLSDKHDKLRRWVFPERIVGPGEYLLVFASGKDGTDPGGFLHTNFKLSGKDAGVYLSDERGILRDSLVIEKLTRNISYGRHLATGTLEYFPTPTPGWPNTSAALSPVVKYSVI